MEDGRQQIIRQRGQVLPLPCPAISRYVWVQRAPPRAPPPSPINVLTGIALTDSIFPSSDPEGNIRRRFAFTIVDVIVN
ncbi:unnamed protein product, partial [Iphiclides podalirius]